MTVKQAPRPRTSGRVTLPEKKAVRTPLKGVQPQKPKRRGVLAPDLAARSATGNFPGFVYNGGPVINTPKVHLLFLGDWSSTANQNRATRLGQFVTDFLTSRYMNILSQYGCGTSGTVVNSVFIASTDTDLSGADINGIFQTAINNADIPEPTDPSVCFVMFLDDATAVDDGSIVMCEAASDTAFGFHDFFTTAAGNTCVFAIVPGLTNACLTDSCPSDAGCSLHLAQTQEQRQTQVASHELSEMFSDPQLDAWTDPINGENGDICNGSSGTITVGPNTWTVQQMYSKWHDMNTAGATTCIVDTPNPLPSLLPAVTLVTDRSTFGKDEVDALLLLGTPAVIDAAFYIIVDGYTPAQLGITAGSLMGVPNVAPAVTLNPAVGGMAVSPTSLLAEDPALGGGIQRFTWIYRVSFSNSSSFPAVVGGVTNITLSASITAVTAPAVSAQGSAIVQLIHEPNPYELDGATSWLSTDLRVFQINAGDSKFGVAMGATAADAPGFIQQVLANLNAGSAGGQTFDGDLSIDENTSALELSEKVNGTSVFNFAVAKVRYRSLAGDAINVRAFFRLFPVSSTSTEYNAGTSYRTGGAAGVKIPLLGITAGELTTIPCFAEPRVDSAAASLDTQTDPTNIRTILHDGSGEEVTAYFGCWLDINQPGQPQFPLNPTPADGPYAAGRQTIQQLIRGAHQCLVAEIAFDPDPIPSGASPGSSDKLAQRNLSIVASDNPGGPASHLIPNTFEVRRSAPAVGARPIPPDELLIDWSRVPPGTEATLYIPGLSAAGIVQLADETYVSHHLRALDDHTLAVATGGLTYVPLPPGTGPNLPGLVTVQLPSTVRKGQAYKVVVRQVTNAAAKYIPPPPPIGAGTGNGHGAPAAERSVVRWRRILGSYQISIPVRTREVMLEPEERLLSVLRWIQEAIPVNDRWHPVFDRYLGVIADRVRALGGNPDLVVPSPSGDWKHQREGEQCLSGKVTEVIFDCYGDFEGFVLDCCGQRHTFRTSERGIGELALRACKDRLLLSVCYEGSKRHHLERIIVRA